MAKSAKVKKLFQEIVTDHVALRWLERVEGYDLAEARQKCAEKRRKPTDQNLLQELYLLYGVTRGHVSYKIVTKPVLAAIKAGATKFHRGDWTLTLRSGRVVTIAPRESHHDRGDRWSRIRRRRSGDEEQVA